MLSTVVMQERVAAPSICTVHAPHSAMPQPNFVPVMPRTSRNTQSSGVSPSTSAVRSTPLTLIVKAMLVSWLAIRCRDRHASDREYLYCTICADLDTRGRFTGR
jgi:hypothetical protein